MIKLFAERKQLEVFNMMKIYAIMNDVKYDDLEAAVMSAEEQELESIEIDIYSDDDKYMRTVETRKEDGYTYTAYCVWDWEKQNYLNEMEVFYDCYESAVEVVKKAPAGHYTIDTVLQDVGQYLDTIEREEYISNIKITFKHTNNYNNGFDETKSIVINGSDSFEDWLRNNYAEFTIDFDMSAHPYDKIYKICDCYNYKETGEAFIVVSMEYTNEETRGV